MPKKGFKQSDEHRRRISQSKKGCKSSYGMLGKKLSIESKYKISIANKGKNKPPRTKEHSLKISIALKGRKKSKEWKEKMKNWMKGNQFAKGSIRSDEQKKKISKFMRETRNQEDNPNWKGGKKRQNKILYGSRMYKEWRNGIFERDNFTCQKTKIKGGKLHPHHIQNFAQYPELRFVIDNGITLSEKDHKEFHKKYGIKNNTKEQIEEFLIIK